MFFRNLTIFRFPVALDLSDLEERLAEHPLKPVGALELSSRGFVSPFGRGAETLAHRVGGAIWLAVGGEDKILPAAVVNDLLAKKVAEVEEREGRRLGGRARKRLKEDLVNELLPRAFVRPGRTDVMLDLAHGLCIVDTSSRKVAEQVVSEIRHALGSFPALPLNAEVAPRAVLTGWAAGEALPDGLSVGHECELKDDGEHGAVVRCREQEIFSDEIGKHLEAGKQVTRLALALDDHVSLVLGEDLVIRKLKFLDGAVEQLEDSEADDVRAELDARFALMAGELRRLFVILEPALKLSRADDSAPAPAVATAARAAWDKIKGLASQDGGRVTISAGDRVILDSADPTKGGDVDPLYEEARAVVLDTQRASISGLQRRMKIGYNRAARLIEALQAAGVVSLPDDRGDRRVLAEKSQ